MLGGGGEEEYQASGIQREIGAMSLEKYLQKLPLAASARRDDANLFRAFNISMRCTTQHRRVAILILCEV